MKKIKGKIDKIKATSDDVIFADLQMINLTLRVLFRPDESKLPHIFSNLGLDYDERVLPSLGNEVLKAVVVCLLSSYMIMYLF